MRNFHFNGRSPVLGTNGMVATSHPLAATEALDVLKDGGNAVDAAIAGALLLGVCEPHMTGIGGDCFALIKPAGGEDVVALNASGRAPQNSDADRLREEGLATLAETHPAAVTVPGAVDGFCRLSERYGNLGLERSLASAIRYFETGVPVAERVAFDLQDLGPHLDQDARTIFLQNGKPFEHGQCLSLPAQADVLRRIARDGRAAFYEGEVAEDMVRKLQNMGGGHTLEDFAKTEATWSEPIVGSYGGHNLIEHPPNGQGATAILLCNILSHFEISKLDPNGTERIHLEAEATKLAYDARNRFLADPDHTTRLDHMLSAKLGEQLAALIDPKRAMDSPSPLTEQVHRDTVLITVVDRDGMAVSLIYSIFASFGSGIASPKFGILFQNRGCGFNLTKGHPNEFGPGKRPMHTIIPAMRAKDGIVDLAFGVMGGQYQSTGHAHFMSNMLDFGMNPQEAIDAPRAFSELSTGELRAEASIAPSVLSELSELGHKVVRPAGPIGGAQAIQTDLRSGVLIGASDPRKDGFAVGY